VELIKFNAFSLFFDSERELSYRFSTTRSSLHHKKKLFHTVIAGELMRGACNNENRLDFITSIKKEVLLGAHHPSSKLVSGLLKNVFASPQKRARLVPMTIFFPPRAAHQCGRLLSAPNLFL
jgi:hypothetical protein